MTMLEAIIEANDTAKIRKLSFAKIDEFQSFMDSFKFVDYPAHLVVPPSWNGRRSNGQNKVQIPFQGWVITRIPEDTNDYRSIKIEENYIAPMRSYAIKYINAFLDTDIIDPEVEEVAWSVNPEYSLTQVGVFGVSYTFNPPINTTLCTY